MPKKPEPKKKAKKKKRRLKRKLKKKKIKGRKRPVSIILKDGTVLEYFDPEIFQEDLEKEIEFLEKEFETEYKGYQNAVEEGFNKSVINESNRLKGTEDPRRAMEISLNKKIKTHSNMISLNDIHAQANMAELAGAKSANDAGATQKKVWVTHFDSIVRPWHDFMNYKKENIKDDFTIPVGDKGYSERAQAPKSFGMSPENYRNCRCFLEYEVG